VVDFGRYGESEIECFMVYAGDWNDMSFLCLSRECAEEQGYRGKLRDWCGDLWKDQDVLFLFYLYACLYREFCFLS